MFPQLAYSVSHTSRAPRSGEIEGKDYHFVSVGMFLDMKDAGEFVEWAQVHGNLYGTSHQQLAAHLKEHRDLLLEIDVQGARQVKAHFPQACFIFVLPPNLETLENRLLKRATEAKVDLNKRLEDASRELLEAPWYDYLIVNDNLDEAVAALAAILTASRHRRQAVLPQVLNLFHPPE
jgi:guanylate kinase